MLKTAKPESLYHYCSAEAFHKIIESKVFRLSNARCMNDPGEVQWAVDLIHSVIADWPPDLRDLISETLRCLPDAYIGSFTDKSDDLPQWREYADDGSGFAIRIDPSPWDLRALIRSTGGVKGSKTTFDGISPALYECVYGEEGGRKKVEDAYARSMSPSHDLKVTRLQHELFQLTMILKADGYRDENEFRIVYSGYDELEDWRSKPGWGDDTFSKKVGRRGFESTPHGIRDHVELKDLPSVVTGVCIGPKNGSCERKGTLRKFLESHGFDLGKEAIAVSAHDYR